MKIEYRTPTVDEYLTLRNGAKWWDVDRNTTETALNNSLFSVVAMENENAIGVGRIVGDGGLYFYIQDLIVHPDFQNMGIGKSLMSALMDYLYSNAKTGAFVGLMAAKGVSRYYASFGFDSRDLDAPGMFQIIK